MAERLFITEHTIETHVKSILRTLPLPSPPTTTDACWPSSPA
ncbi:MAG TPA: hypothetical protein VGL78_17495 [Solirubrobacteraceae bacterium]